MSDSEDDYMSDKLLVGSEKDDLRPGLVFNKSEKRRLDMFKKQQDERVVKKPKSYKEQEKETREKGLNTAISSENKGFKLLEKMGYKPGSSLGKDTSGITEPINVTVKENAGGMGRETHIKEVMTKKIKAHSSMLKTIERDFQATNAEKMLTRFLFKDMYKAQKICEELDFRQQIKFPIDESFWTNETMKKLKEKEREKESDDSEESDSEDEDDQPEPTVENLKSLIDYLRNTYYYCMYCAITFEGEDDIKTNCPGSYRDDHDD